jgi:hypothetical protein
LYFSCESAWINLSKITMRHSWKSRKGEREREGARRRGRGDKREMNTYPKSIIPPFDPVIHIE